MEKRGKLRLAVDNSPRSHTSPLPPNSSTEIWRTIGIIGGAGPRATAYAATRLVELCQRYYNAVDDADFPQWLVSSIPSFGLNSCGCESARSSKAQLIKALRGMESAGVEVAIIACNTLHQFQNEVEKGLNLRIVSLPDCGAKAVARSGIKRVAVLCSEESERLQLHHSLLRRYGVETVKLPPTLRRQTTRLIERVMAGAPSTTLSSDFNKLCAGAEEAGAEAILLGCTELSCINQYLPHSVPVVDCLNASLEQLLEFARIDAGVALKLNQYTNNAQSSGGEI